MQNTNEDLGPLGWASRKMIIGGLAAVFLLVVGAIALAFFFASSEAVPANRNQTLLAAPALKYYAVDRVIALADYPRLAAWGINTVIVSFDVNGSATTWRNILSTAQANNIGVVIWPSDWTYPRADCNWEAPYPVTATGDISRVTRLMDVASEYTSFIGIVNAHETFWSCDSTFDEQAGLRDKLKAYALSKGRSIKIWNYINSLYTESKFPASQIPRIMDVAVTWKHFAGGAEGTFAQAKAQIASDKARLPTGVELVYLMQTFTTSSPYTVKFTLAQLQTYSCEILATGNLDGFAYYTWGANWWSDLSEWTELHPAIPYVRDCAGAPPVITLTPQAATVTPVKTPTRTRTPTPTRTEIPPTRTATPPPNCDVLTDDKYIVTICEK